MNAHKIQQPYILLKPDNFHFDGHFHALQSLENVQPRTNADSLDSKKRNTLEGKRQKPLAMSRRNARERRRVKLINLGYETLRHHVPAGIENKKLSKVETLRSAVNYIKYLQSLLESNDPFKLDSPASSQQSQESDNQNGTGLVERTLSSDSSVEEQSPVIVKEERLDNHIPCSQSDSVRETSTAAEPAAKEDHVFIDIAKWLCQNSDSIKHSNFKFKGKDTGIKML
ncbi:hypothetical protein FSP39_003545 [Pinctada imbricata]|uniref:BHLH domain-containing protein n=1 Tax=Pinctada imbricata TaxID=66713 RepID=A0AA88YH71_PINIB|nr:hypothetical protein FSP39_003545 [Pinctada imbricata]